MGNPGFRKASLAKAGWGRGRESEGAREPPSRAVVGARKFLGPAF